MQGQRSYRYNGKKRKEAVPDARVSSAQTKSTAVHSIAQQSSVRAKILVCCYNNKFRFPVLCRWRLRMSLTRHSYYFPQLPTLALCSQRHDYECRGCSNANPVKRPSTDIGTRGHCEFPASLIGRRDIPLVMYLCRLHTLSHQEAGTLETKAHHGVRD